MACPTCDHTMESITFSPQFFWCPRCGTLVSAERQGEYAVPKLVDRAREFQVTTTKLGEIALELVKKWISIGVDESVNIPQERIKRE